MKNKNNQSDKENISSTIEKKEKVIRVVMPLPTNLSPLNVTGVNMNLTSKEIVGFIHESRKLVIINS